MPDNERDLTVWQVATQPDFETLTTPTIQLEGVEDGTLTPHVEVKKVPQQDGTLTPVVHTKLSKKTGEASLDFSLCVEDLPYWLSSFFAIATPGVDPYPRVYTGAGAKPTSRILSILKANDIGANSLVGGVVNSLEVTGETNETTKGKVALIGHSVVPDTVEALSARPSNFLHGNDTTIYIDPAGGSFGATAWDTQTHNFVLSLNRNASLKMSLGSVSPLDYADKKPDEGGNTLKLSVAVDAASIALYTAILNTTQVGGAWMPLIRIEQEIAVGLSWVTDYAGYAPEAPVWDIDNDGIASLEFMLNAIYDSSLGSWIETTVENGVAILP